MAIQDLRGKVVVVTGAASGIGRETALAFAREGAHIVAADLTAEPLEAVRKELEALGVPCMAYAVDVADEAGMKAFAGAVEARFGAPHVVINNAGIGYLGPFLKSDLAHWRRMLDVNVMGVVHGCYFFLPMMIAAGGPRSVLNVSSSAGNFPSPSMAAYGASKGAVSNLSEVLKMELADSDVQIVTVCPGVVNTPIIRSHLGTSPAVSDATLAKLRAYYASDGCSPDVIARDMLRAVKRGGDLVLTGPKSRLIHHLRRVSSKLLRAVMIRFARQSGFLE